jgi:hypothetical protein
MSAAKCKRLSASVVVPILVAVFASASVASRELFISKPIPAAPATPTKAVLRFRAAPATALRPFVIPPKAFLVLSKAFMVINTSLLAIVFLAHYFVVSEPLVEFTQRHLLCLTDAHMQPISQGN